MKNNLYLCCPLLNTECSKEICYINGGECFKTIKEKYSQEHLLDYITNLQEETEYYKKQLELSHQVIVRPYEDSELAEIVDNHRNMVKSLVKRLNKKQNIIDKAIECINYYATENDDYSKLYSIEEEELLEILQGEQNE